MAITYPLTLPDPACVQRVSITPRNAVAETMSPYTYHSKIYGFSGEMWQAQISLAPMRRATAAAWVSFLVKCRGMRGTFLLGDPFAARARGTATQAAITGAAQDRTVSVSMAGTLLEGDMIQIGAGDDASLHMVLQDRAGSGPLEIWPALRKARSNAAVTLNAPKGVFRLVTNAQGWDVDELALYGITFAAREVVL
jgi:hypothetical protein